MVDSTQIAAAVLATAKALDPKMPKPDPTILAAWAAVFEGQPVWPQEAVRAVAEHYRSSDERLMPVHVLNYCKNQPVTSSPEHVSYFLDIWAQHPWSTAIEELVGKPIPGLEPDSNDVADKPRLIEQRRQFIAKHREYFVDQIMAKAGQKEIAA